MNFPLAEAVNPDNAIDLWYALIVGLPSLVTAFGVFYGQRIARRRWTTSEKSTGEVLFELKNDHDSNLRDDITGIKNAVQTGFADMREDIHGIREELRTERIERIEGDKRG